MENRSESTEKRSAVVDITLEMKAAVVTLGGPRSEHDTRESMIARAARRASISYRTAKSLFYTETTDPKASVVERVRNALANHNTKAEGAARDEFKTLLDRIALVEARLDAIDPDVAGARLVEAFGPAALRRGLGSPMDRR